MSTWEEDTFGYETSSHVSKIEKGKHRMLNMTINGGSPECPCVYITSIEENSPVHGCETEMSPVGGISIVRQNIIKDLVVDELQDIRALS
ncbi:hypothetical protein GJ496_000797 [Pomphorhynchus laevis]|nr:hypothetical protein GJ496_000797 [Pomphorhynchus laevis]